MNDLSKTYRPCTLTDGELADKIDAMVEQMFQSGKLPSRNVLADANSDFDFLIDELILRFKEYARLADLNRTKPAKAV